MNSDWSQITSKSLPYLFSLFIVLTSWMKTRRALQDTSGEHFDGVKDKEGLMVMITWNMQLAENQIAIYLALLNSTIILLGDNKTGEALIFIFVWAAFAVLMSPLRSKWKRLDPRGSVYQFRGLRIERSLVMTILDTLLVGVPGAFALSPLFVS